MSLPLLLTCGPLEISFSRQHDRIAHAIRFRDQADCFMQSVEGNDLDDWPASPAFRDLHRESRPGDRQVILLVGMAGTSHWSASFEIDPRQATIAADVACRLHQSPGPLGSRYDASSAAWSVTQQLAVAKNPDHTAMAVLNVDHVSGKLLHSARGLQIVPALDPANDRYPQTVQWRYRLTGWPAPQNPSAG